MATVDQMTGVEAWLKIALASPDMAQHNRSPGCSGSQIDIIIEVRRPQERRALGETSFNRTIAPFRHTVLRLPSTSHPK